MGFFGHGRHVLYRRVWQCGGVGALALAVAFFALPAERAAAQGAVKSVHKDWQIRCDTRPAPKPSNAR